MKRNACFTVIILIIGLIGTRMSSARAATIANADDSRAEPGAGPRYDVTHFGAAGDGKTDDTAAIQAAFDACWSKGTGVAPYGGVVEFPGPHTYIISKTINVYDSCRVEGSIGALSSSGTTSPPDIRWRGPAYGATAKIAGFTISRNVASITLAANPVPGHAVTVNGVEIDFVASGANGNQVNIGSSAAATATALADFLNASPEQKFRVSRPFTNPTPGEVDFKYQSIGLNGKTESVASRDAREIAVRPALYPPSSPSGGRDYPYMWLATFSGENSFSVGDWVYINGFKSSAGMTMNNLVSTVLEASATSFTVFIPAESNAPKPGAYKDSAMSTSISVDLASDSYSRYEESFKDIRIIGGGVGIYLGSRVDTGSHFQNTWLGVQSYFSFYFSAGGLNVDFDKGWRGDSPGLAAIYWRVSGGDNLGIANGQTSTDVKHRGAAVMLDNQGCNGKNDLIHFSARNVAFEAGADYAPGLGSIVLYDCTSSVFPEQFGIDMEGVSTAWDQGVTYAPTIVMTPQNDTALTLGILNGTFPDSKSSPRWVGIPGLLRSDASPVAGAPGNFGIIPSLTYGPSFKSTGGVMNERYETAMSQCLGDCNFGQLWQYGAQASAILYTDTAFRALPNGTTLFAGQIIAPPDYWKNANSNHYVLNVVEETGTTGIPNQGATTCQAGKLGTELLCSSAIDLSVGQHISVGPVRDAAITHLDAGDPGSVLLTLNKSMGAVSTPARLAFFAPGLGQEIELRSKGSGRPATNLRAPASGETCDGCSGAGVRTAQAFCAGQASSSATLAMSGAAATACIPPAAAANGAQILMNTSGILSNLAVRCAHSGMQEASGVFSVWDLPSGSPMSGANSGVNTGLTVTYGTTGANTTLFDSTHSFKFAKGDLLRIQFTTQANETLGDCVASFNY